ncbi:MAG: DEP domain-containing protein [Prochloraceae cyanobacterium]
MNKNKTAVFSILMMRFGIDAYTAIPLTKNWFDRHPDKTWADLREYLIDGEVIFKYGKLHDIDPLEIKALVQKMRGADGLEIKDRWFHFKLYRSCFTGDDAVQWLMKNKNLTKQEAIQLGRILVKHSIIHHVHNEHNFKDGFLFFRFYEDEITLGNKEIKSNNVKEKSLFPNL